jgi:hypothetical protein
MQKAEQFECQAENDGNERERAGTGGNDEKDEGRRFQFPSFMSFPSFT